MPLSPQPCQSSYCYCQEVLDRLIQCGLLVAEEVGRAAGDKVPAQGLASFSLPPSDGGPGSSSGLCVWGACVRVCVCTAPGLAERSLVPASPLSAMGLVRAHLPWAIV